MPIHTGAQIPFLIVTYATIGELVLVGFWFSAAAMFVRRSCHCYE